MRILFLLFFLLLSLNASNPRESGQLLVVTASNWTTSSASLQRLYYAKGRWWERGSLINVKLGRNGLGWGLGLHRTPSNAKIVKKEGDGKAPAGIFRLKQAFGYASFAINYPYKVYRESDHCVDDVGSRFYNKIIDSRKVSQSYKSYENMKFAKNYYKYGIVVNHNGIGKGERSKKGAGSCIFLHIKNIPTAGCTVMKENEIKALLRWLDPNANPLLVQGTTKEIKGLMKQIKGKEF